MGSKHFDRRIAALDRALLGLSKKARTVFVLHRRDGRAIDKIAERLSVPGSMVQEYLARAIQQCNRQIPNPEREVPIDIQIESEAADWLLKEVRNEESNSRTRKRFNWWANSKPLYLTPLWFRALPDLMHAYTELKHSWEDARFCDRARTIDIESLIAEVRTDMSLTSILTPRSSETGGGGIAVNGYRASANRGRFKWAAAAALAFVITAGVLAGSLFWPQEYSTAIGERRTVRLPDGSVVELDGVSRIRVHYSARERRIDLLEGQALFKVTKNAARPFVVESNGIRVRDIGTQFNVNQIVSDTVVTVLEGRVEVTYGCPPITAPSSAPAILHSIELGAGQKVDATCNTIPRPQSANLTTTMAWTHYALIFDSTPLMQVAVEFNRFNVRQLVIEGADLQSFPVGGVFPESSSTSLPRLLQILRANRIQVVEADDRIIVGGGE